MYTWNQANKQANIYIAMLCTVGVSLAILSWYLFWGQSKLLLQLHSCSSAIFGCTNGGHNLVQVTHSNQ